MTTTLLSALSDDQLADEIVSWSGRIAAGEARLLALIAEFDQREAWSGPGLLSCAHWLQWRVGLGPGAARERVRVARRLEDLPEVRRAFAKGRLSYSQVRAITRGATPDSQQQWLEMSAHSTAGQLERLARGVARVRRAAEDEADPEAAEHRMRATKRYDEDGTAVYTIRMPAPRSCVLDAALEQVRADLDRELATAAKAAAETAAAAMPAGTSGPAAAGADAGPDAGRAVLASAAAAGLDPASGDVSAETPLRRSTLADAFLALAGRVLEQTASDSPATSRRSRAALDVHVDPLTGWGRLRDGELLPPVSLRDVLRALPGRSRTSRRSGLFPLRRLTAEDLRAHDSGRTRRRPTPALRDLLGTLDGERCRYPGCSRGRRLHAHHVREWAAGGATDLDNLVLLCPRHHTLVHAEGYRLRLHSDRQFDVETSEGGPVPHRHALPWRPAAELDPARRISAETLPPPLADQRLDLGYAVMVLVQQAA